MTLDTWKTTTLEAYLEAHQPPALTVFQHIPKTAGSSLVAEMNRHIGHYTPIEIDYNDPDPDVHQRVNKAVARFLDAWTPEETRCTSGHIFREQVEQILARVPDVGLFTFLRSPVARFVSDYRYQCTVDHPGHEDFLRRFPTIEHYLDATYEMNKMCRYLIGKDVAVEDGIAFVERNFHFVGIQEMYPMSFNILMRLQGVDALPTERVRQTKAIAQNEVALSDTLVEEILARNAKDAALYDHFHKLLLSRRDQWREMIGAN
ncbi:sulfotransferase family 2 domain-containing protein [Plastorhodobacter daqingensis]|uniref:Sulfotransferase family 2 domain-containing protein n=1 Tax=Plastorhodobacter daqingensis TaxID=1387281 RepID=A0ABW2UJA8_9RHOB